MSYAGVESVEEIETYKLEYLRHREHLLKELLPHINDTANRVSDDHVIRWHRGFGKSGKKTHKGSKFLQCWCVPGMLRDILMKEGMPK